MTKPTKPQVNTLVGVVGRLRSRGKYYGHIEVEGGTIHFVDVDGDLVPCKAVKVLPKDLL